MKRASLMLLFAAGLAGASAGAQEIGRLFTTPAERATLERQRSAGRPLDGAADAAPALREPVEGEHIIEISGTVRRSGKGRATTWIDAVPHSADGKFGEGLRLGQDTDKGLVTVTLRSGKVVRVKPGQRVDAVSGKVLEGYQSGRLFIPSQKKSD